MDRLNSELTAVREDLGAQLDTVKNSYNLAVDELSESKTVVGQLLERLNKVDAVVEAKTAENEKLLKDLCILARRKFLTHKNYLILSKPRMRKL